MIYFDNAASTFPKPTEVSIAVYKALNEYGANPGRSGHFLSEKAAERIYYCRTLIAEFFGASPEKVCFTGSNTAAINTVLLGRLKSGDKLIISDIEHNSVRRPSNLLADKGVVLQKFCVFPDDPQKTLRSVADAAEKGADMLFCTSGSNVLGNILPIHEIGKMCKNKGILFGVDSAQTAGFCNINMKEDNIDYLCFSGHKGLYGPQGVGGFIIGENAPPPTPLIYGGTGGNSFERLQPSVIPERYESGTVCTPNISGLCAGIEFLNKEGIDNIRKSELETAEYLYDRLCNMGAILYSKFDKNRYCPVISFNFKGVPSNIVTGTLSDNGVCTRDGFHCNPDTHMKIGTTKSGTVRISLSYSNNRAQAVRFINILNKIVKNL